MPNSTNCGHVAPPVTVRESTIEDAGDGLFVKKGVPRGAQVLEEDALAPTLKDMVYVEKIAQGRKHMLCLPLVVRILILCQQHALPEWFWNLAPQAKVFESLDNDDRDMLQRIFKATGFDHQLLLLMALRAYAVAATNCFCCDCALAGNIQRQVPVMSHLISKANHSKKPNVATATLKIEVGLQESTAKVCLVALKKIRKNNELFVDYGDAANGLF